MKMTDSNKNKKEDAKNFAASDANYKDLSTIVKGGGITLIGSITGKMLLFFYTVFLARFLRPDELGLYFIVITVMLVLSSIASLGISTGVVRYVAIYNAKNDLGRVKGTIISGGIIGFIISFIIVIILFIVADPVSQVIFHKPDLAPYLKILSLTLPCESLMRTFLAATQGLKLMRYSSLTENVAWVFLRVLFSLIIVVIHGASVQGFLFAYVLSSMICAIIAFYFANKHIPILSRQIKPIYDNLTFFKFSIPMMISVFLFSLSKQVDVLMLGIYISNSGVGIYSVALRTVFIAEFVHQIFVPIFNPFVSEFSHSKEYIKISKLLKTITRWNIIVSLPIFLSMLLFPKFFLILFGSGFIEASKCLTILVAANIISSISILPNSMIYMMGRSDIVARNNLLYLLIIIGFNFLLITRYGIIGAAVTAGIALITVGSIRIIEVYRLMKVTPFHQSLFKPIFGGIISVICSLLISRLTIMDNFFYGILSVISFVTIYAILITTLGFNKEDKNMAYLIGRKLYGYSKSIF